MVECGILIRRSPGSFLFEFGQFSHQFINGTEFLSRLGKTELRCGRDFRQLLTLGQFDNFFVDRFPFRYSSLRFRQKFLAFFGIKLNPGLCQI
ncbi:MAG: hypothetical protein H7835_17885, partial [Magnetococcus sp. XQGC-1]